MKRAWISILCLSLVPAAVAAQTTRPPAPRVADVHNRGITVSASGIDHINADSARLTVHLGSLTGASVYNAKVLAGVVDAMVASGIDRSSIQLPPNLQTSATINFATISGKTEAPAAGALQRGIAAISTAVAAIPGAIVQETQIALRAQHCDAQQTEARRTAIVAARQKALTIAKQLDVKLGNVVSVTSTDQTLPDGSCANTYSISAYGAGIEQSEDYRAIPVFSSVTITYAIQ